VGITCNKGITGSERPGVEFYCAETFGVYTFRDKGYSPRLIVWVLLYFPFLFSLFVSVSVPIKVRTLLYGDIYYRERLERTAAAVLFGCVG